MALFAHRTAWVCNFIPTTSVYLSIHLFYLMNKLQPYLQLFAIADSNGWAGVLSVACGRTHLGICSAAGVCYCEDNTKYCKCLPEDEVGKYIFGNNSHEGNVTSVIVNNKGI